MGEGWIQRLTCETQVGWVMSTCISCNKPILDADLIVPVYQAGAGGVAQYVHLCCLRPEPRGNPPIPTLLGDADLS